MADTLNTSARNSLTLKAVEKNAEYTKETQTSEVLALRVNRIEEEGRSVVSPLWEVGVVVVGLLVVAIIRRAFPKKVVQYANAFISNRFVGQLTREERNSESMSVVLFELFYFVVLALFANLSYKAINPDFLFYGFEGFALFLFVFLVLHLVKVLANNLLGWVLDFQSVINDFLFFNFLNRVALAAFLFPLIILLLFSHLNQEFMLGLGAFLILSLYLHRMSKFVLRTWNEKRFLPKYFILYICGLEILPVLVLAKFASKTL